jgi:hypothetical protein
MRHPCQFRRGLHQLLFEICHCRIPVAQGIMNYHIQLLTTYMSFFSRKSLSASKVEYSSLITIICP